MISRTKRYSFNSKTLSFVEDKKWSGQRILKSLTRFAFINIIAIILVFALNAFVKSPEIFIQQTRINRFNSKYELMNARVDSLSNILWSNLQTNDLLYRDILQLDSISPYVRSAGIGGHEKSKDIFYFTNEIYSKLVSNINTLQRQLNIQEESFNDIQSAAEENNAKISHIPGIQPVKPDKGIWVSSKFGYRRDPFLRFRRFHKGVDFVGAKNTRIYTTAEGVVTLVKHSRIGYGNEVVVDHGFGYTTRYAHLNKILVRKGQKLKRGELLGLMGSTGRSTGTHLHYEVRYYNNPVNPYHYFTDDLLPDEYEELTLNQ